MLKINFSSGLSVLSASLREIYMGCYWKKILNSLRRGEDARVAGQRDVLEDAYAGSCGEVAPEAARRNERGIVMGLVKTRRFPCDAHGSSGGSVAFSVLVTFSQRRRLYRLMIFLIIAVDSGTKI